MMHAEHVRNGKTIREWDALNDVVVAKGTIARMGDYTVEIDKQPSPHFAPMALSSRHPPAQPPTTWLRTVPS